MRKISNDIDWKNTFLTECLQRTLAFRHVHSAILLYEQIACMDSGWRRAWKELMLPLTGGKSTAASPKHRDFQPLGWPSCQELSSSSALCKREVLQGVGLAPIKCWMLCEGWQGKTWAKKKNTLLFLLFSSFIRFKFCTKFFHISFKASIYGQIRVYVWIKLLVVLTKELFS